MLADTARIINDSAAWTDAVRRFEHAGLTDPEALDLHRLFGDWLRASLARHELALSGFGCGRSLCAATIPLAAHDGRARYDLWKSAEASQPPMPLPVFVEFMSPMSSDASEIRILFSTDPDVSAIQAPDRPAP
ncbi:conserved hypothetical protein [Luteimonas sp. 9C]|nr:conserved hypothetical protein [Luteimonas sp. 9C]